MNNKNKKKIEKFEIIISTNEVIFYRSIFEIKKSKPKLGNIDAENQFNDFS